MRYLVPVSKWPRTAEEERATHLMAMAWGMKRGGGWSAEVGAGAKGPVHWCISAWASAPRNVEAASRAVSSCAASLHPRYQTARLRPQPCRRHCPFFALYFLASGSLRLHLSIMKLILSTSYANLLVLDRPPHALTSSQQYNDLLSLLLPTSLLREIKHRTHIRPPRKLHFPPTNRPALHQRLDPVKALLPNMDVSTRGHFVYTNPHALPTHRAPRVLRHNRETLLPTQHPQLKTLHPNTGSHPSRTPRTRDNLHRPPHRLVPRHILRCR